MSQRSEKLHRQVDRLKDRVDLVESRVMEMDSKVSVHEYRIDRLWDEALAKTKDAENTEAAHNADNRRAREAERAVAAWRRMTYTVLVASIVVLLAAILVVNAEADDTVAIDPHVGVTALKILQGTAEEPEEAENERIEAALLARANVIENCLVTHYDACVECCGKDDGITASGVRATPGVTVAVDPSVIPLGSDVLVDYGDGELHYYRADDVGGAVRGNHIDLCVGSHEEAVQLGRRTATVYWCSGEE